jgi:hypothetical protein
MNSSARQKVYQNVVVDEKSVHAAGADGVEMVVALVLFSVPNVHLSVHRSLRPVEEMQQRM